MGKSAKTIATARGDAHLLNYATAKNAEARKKYENGTDFPPSIDKLPIQQMNGMTWEREKIGSGHTHRILCFL